MPVVGDDIHGSVGLVPISCLMEIHLSWYTLKSCSRIRDRFIEYYDHCFMLVGDRYSWQGRPGTYLFSDGDPPSWYIEVTLKCLLQWRLAHFRLLRWL